MFLAAKHRTTVDFTAKTVYGETKMRLKKEEMSWELVSRKVFLSHPHISPEAYFQTHW